MGFGEPGEKESWKELWLVLPHSRGDTVGGGTAGGACRLCELWAFPKGCSQCRVPSWQLLRGC